MSESYVFRKQGGKKKEIHKRPDTGRGKSIRPSLDTSTVCRGLTRNDLSGRVRKSTGGEKAEGCQITQELKPVVAGLMAL